MNRPHSSGLRPMPLQPNSPGWVLAAILACCIVGLIVAIQWLCNGLMLLRETAGKLPKTVEVNRTCEACSGNCVCCRCKK